MGCLRRRWQRKKQKNKQKNMHVCWSLLSDQFNCLDVALDYLAGPTLVQHTNTATQIWPWILYSATDTEWDSAVSDIRLPVTLIYDRLKLQMQLWCVWLEANGIDSLTSWINNALSLVSFLLVSALCSLHQHHHHCWGSIMLQGSRRDIRRVYCK